ncbi:hyaluronidase PH-20-like [Perognathus longimembris pacificus]|uniref:hyaluronidase PH-20-like n=1 Tax=Perognathus longimembris pacificus TaxID=214514 RepID=UPI002019E2F3|nr:hyaluronidase PH-20-like [Perognathus longimembris pacificus]
MSVLSFKHLLVFRSSSELYRISQTVLVFLLIPCCLARDFRASPIIPHKPLVWAWNVPTQPCVSKFKENIDLSLFSLIGNPMKSAVGQNVTLFYVDRLGYYPHMDHHQNSVHGGIPQLGDLQAHLTKAKDDIFHYIPEDKLGLAVIDWEEWRPTWDRNWRPKDIYRNKSIELVQQRDVALSLPEATKIAKEEFESSGKKFMLETLKLGKSVRPKQLWGYYLFPDCYNHNYKKDGYNGHCPDVEKKRNDALQWLWEESSALFPSIYLHSDLGSSHKAAVFTRNRIVETIKVSQVRDVQNPVPFFVYIRLVYTDKTTILLNKEDLMHTVGETVALGASGIIVWGTLSWAQTLKSCMTLRNYMDSTLIPYFINVTLASKMCNQALCQDQGVCTRKNWDTDDYLHLNPERFTINSPRPGQYVINGKPTLNDLQDFSKSFKCSCFPNTNCNERADLENIEIINVCVTEDVCIQGSFKPSNNSAYSFIKSLSPRNRLMLSPLTPMSSHEKSNSIPTLVGLEEARKPNEKALQTLKEKKIK